MKTAIALIAIAQTILWAGLYYLFPAFLLHWETAYSWSRSELTFALTAAVFASALLSPLAGSFIDRGKGKLLLAGCGLIGGMLITALPEIHSQIGFYILWTVIGGAMAGCLYEPCFAVIVRYQGEKAKHGITVITLVAGFASTICFPLAHWLIETYGIDTALRVFGLGIIGGAVPLIYIGTGRLQKLSQRTVFHEEITSKPASKPFLKSPVFWLIGIAFSLTALNHGIVLNHLLPMLGELRFSSEEAVLAISMIGPMQVAGRIFWMMADRLFDIEKIGLICFAMLNVAALTLIGSSQTSWLVGVFILFQGSAYGVLNIVKPVLTRDLMGENQFGAMMGVMAVPFLIAFAIAPYVGSILWQFSNYDVVRWFIFACTFIGIFCLGVAIAKHKKKLLQNEETVAST